MEKTAQTNEYMQMVRISVFGGPDNVDINLLQKSSLIKFSIDVEYRSWGIKDISVTILSSFIEIPIESTTFSNNQDLTEDKKIVVDISKLKQEFIQSNAVTLREMDIYLDNNYNVDYKSSSIVIEK